MPAPLKVAIQAIRSPYGLHPEATGPVKAGLVPASMAREGQVIGIGIDFAALPGNAGSFQRSHKSDFLVPLGDSFLACGPNLVSPADLARAAVAQSFLGHDDQLDIMAREHRLPRDNAGATSGDQRVLVLHEGILLLRAMRDLQKLGQKAAPGESRDAILAQAISSRVRVLLCRDHCAHEMLGILSDISRIASGLFSQPDLLFDDLEHPRRTIEISVTPPR